MSEQRPDLAAVAPTMPDVLVRLEAEMPVAVVVAAEAVIRREALATWWAKNSTARDAMDCIEYLRAANQRHCNTERDLKAASGLVRQLEAENAGLRRGVADRDAAAAEFRARITALEADLAAARACDGR